VGGISAFDFGGRRFRNGTICSKGAVDDVEDVDNISTHLLLLK